MSTYTSYAGYSHHAQYSNPYGYNLYSTAPYATMGAGYYNGDGDSLKFSKVANFTGRVLVGAGKLAIDIVLGGVLGGVLDGVLGDDPVVWPS